MKMGSTKTQIGESPSIRPDKVNVRNVTIPKNPPTEHWLPPVHITHLKPGQQDLVRRVLFEEVTALAHDSDDIGLHPLTLNVSQDHRCRSGPESLCFNSKTNVHGSEGEQAG